MASSSALLEVDGCPISYRVDGDGPPVILVQGVGVPGSGWKPQIESLSSRFRCLTFDNRGIGQSVPFTGSLSVEMMAGDVLALMDSQKWESAHCIGHSLGGSVALQAALMAPRRIRSLSLLCTFASGKAVAPLSWRMAWAGLRVQFGTRSIRRRAFLELILPPSALQGTDRDALAARLAVSFGRDLGDQPSVVPRQLRALRRFDATSRLKELGHIPTLVMSAEHDPIAPPALGQAIAAGIPGARYLELADASHGVTIADPGRVNLPLVEHLLSASR